MLTLDPALGKVEDSLADLLPLFFLPSVPLSPLAEVAVLFLGEAYRQCVILQDLLFIFGRLLLISWVFFFRLVVGDTIAVSTRSSFLVHSLFFF